MIYFYLLIMVISSESSWAVDLSTVMPTAGVVPAATSSTAKINSATVSPLSLPSNSSLIQNATPLPSPSTTATLSAPTWTPSPLSAPFDYTVNLNSDVFGAHLFSGSFAQQSALHFNPNYRLQIGDQIQVRLWGGFTFDGLLTIDAQGHLFLPQVGPVKVLGIENQHLQAVITQAVHRVFRANVYNYASLAAAQPVRIFVGGYINRPGLYYGTSMDSILHYLDQAGGIDADRGSFLTVEIKRGEQIRAIINLYDFLLKGDMPAIQLADGDMIFIPPRQQILKVNGLAENAKWFEFSAHHPLMLTQLLQLAKPKPEATHVRISRSRGLVKNIDYYPLSAANQVHLYNGDEIELTADKRPGTITVRVEGEHQSPQEYVLKYGSRLGQLLSLIQLNSRSEAEHLQLYRQSVRDRQKQLLQTALQTLETRVLTARSGSNEEALLRKEEANLILQWIDRVKNSEPNGQVVIAQNEQRQQLLLENGDVIKIPTRDPLILVSGEVLFPNTIPYNEEFEIADYINQAGGYTQTADTTRVVIAHRDGSFDDAAENEDLLAGDEILILPKIQIKNRQIFKELSQVIYQTALATRVITRF